MSRRNDDIDGSDDADVPRKQKRRRRGTDTALSEPDLSSSSHCASRRANSLPDSQLSSRLVPSIEEQATQHFFKSFALPSPSKETTRGFFEVAESMFDRAEQDSPVRLATQAVAIVVAAKRPGQVYLAQLAARVYGKALAATQQAMQEPVDATSDTTLLTILLFSLYESITSSDHSKSAWNKHIDGAVAIVKARGVEQFKNPESLSLFRAVRTQMITNAVQQRKTIEDFPGPKGWLSDMDDDQPAAFNLLAVSIALPNLFSKAQVLLAQERTSESTVEVESLLQEAQKLQHALVEWEVHMPAEGTNRLGNNSVGLIEPHIIEQKEGWSRSVRACDHINISSVWNNHRINMMLCSSVVVDALRWLNPEGYLEDGRCCEAKSRVQSLFDDICYSDTSNLEDQEIEGNPTADAISSAGKKPQRRRFHRRTLTKFLVAEGIGGYFHFWPLYTASTTNSIPDIPKRWMRGRLRSIAKRCGLEQASIFEPPENHDQVGLDAIVDELFWPGAHLSQDEPFSPSDNMCKCVLI